MVTAVRVQVTQQDISDGSRRGDSCPCALAAKRVLPQFPGLWFGIYRWAALPTGSDDSWHPLSHEVSEWIRRYDHTRLVQPFEFDLDVPDDLLAGAS